MSSPSGWECSGSPRRCRNRPRSSSCFCIVVGCRSAMASPSGSNFPHARVFTDTRSSGREVATLGVMVRKVVPSHSYHNTESRFLSAMASPSGKECFGSPRRCRNRPRSSSCFYIVVGCRSAMASPSGSNFPPARVFTDTRFSGREVATLGVMVRKVVPSHSYYNTESRFLSEMSSPSGKECFGSPRRCRDRPRSSSCLYIVVG